ncbi:MAG: hypothetical protein O3A00_00010 [Planctomycetota bacterium]|nr:hypothetical protein [Planctomycetota bacterium]
MFNPISFILEMHWSWNARFADLPSQLSNPRRAASVFAADTMFSIGIDLSVIHDLSAHITRLIRRL